MNEIISFYSKIYKQELSQSKMLHLNSSRITKRIHTADKEELLTGEHPRIPLNDKDGVELTKILALKSNEVELRYFSLARVSKFISLNKYESTRIYPLLSYEAHLLFIDGAYYMEIDLTSRNVLKNNLPQTIAGSDEFRKLKQSQTIDIHFTSKLKSIIDKYTPKPRLMS